MLLLASSQTRVALCSVSDRPRSGWQHVGVLMSDSAIQSYSFNVDRTVDRMLLVSSGHLLVPDGKE